MSQIEQFIATNQLTMRVKPVDHNPYMDGDHGATMDHWKCTIRNGLGVRLTVTFSQGSGHHGNEPTIDDVLDCLASDAAGYENARNFEEWADDYGYSPDSRRAERAYNAIGKEVDSLKSLLGIQYHTLLWDTERL